jgi:4a-hydroxytetrahydrobiopterin dehydratase
MLKPYTTTEIYTNLKDIRDWMYINNTLQKEWEFEDFESAIAFITAVAQIAERQDHHPQIINTCNRVRLRLSTHSVKGITRRDFLLAQLIDRIK